MPITRQKKNILNDFLRVPMNESDQHYSILHTTTTIHCNATATTNTVKLSSKARMELALKMATSNVFITVGTTQFDKLVLTVISDKVLEVLSKKGCRSLVLQTGQGKIVPETEKHGIKIKSFPLKPSITEEISRADLVISHAGAGTCLGVLNANKPLVVVINEDLMDNHQQELADKLAEEGYLFKSNCGNLASVLENADLNSLKPYTLGDATVYTNYIDCIMGFSD